MKIGFTGTRKGMTEFQKSTLIEWLLALDATEFHHGDCFGADEEAHKIAVMYKLKIVIHPPINDSQRAFCNYYESKTLPTTLVKKGYLERNKDIVDSTDVLIAAPKGPEELRSGTWSTVRYAEKKGKKYYILDWEKK